MAATDPPTPLSDRPLPVVDLVDGAFHALRQRPRTLVLGVLWLAGPAAILRVYIDANVLGYSGRSPMAFVSGVGQLLRFEGLANGAVANVIVSLFVTATTGVTVARIVGGWSSGVDLGAVDAITFTVRRMPAIVVAFIVTHVLAGLGWIVVIPGVLCLLWFALVSPVLALETDLGPIAAIRRSKQLATGDMNAVFGVVFVLFLTTSTLLAGTAIAVSTYLDLSDRVYLVAVTVTGLLTSMVLLPLNGAAMTLVYLDARYRSEGFDLDTRIRSTFPSSGGHRGG